MDNTKYNEPNVAIGAIQVLPSAFFMKIWPPPKNPPTHPPTS